jgi:phage tail sheath protein FI
MPNLQTPGVYIQEVPLGPAPIQGVSTSIAGFVGEAERGLTYGSPSLVTSFADFQNQFGGFVAGKYLAYAVQGFFANGGQSAFIARVVDPSAKPASVAPGTGYDVAIISFSVVSVAAGTPFTVRAASVVGLAEVTVSGATSTPTQILLIDRMGNAVATLTVTQVSAASGAIVVTSNVGFGTGGSAPALNPATYALRYAAANTTPGTFAFTARDQGVFGNGLRVLLTPTYLATATIQGIAGTSPPAYIVSTTAPFEQYGQVEFAKATSPSTRDIETVASVDATTNTITLQSGTTVYAVGDYIRVLGWTLQTYYNGKLVETLTGISSSPSASDGMSSINNDSQWITVASPYPTFALAGAPTQASLTGATVLTAAIAGTLATQTLQLTSDTGSFTVTFPSGMTTVAAILAAISAQTNGSILAVTTAAGFLVLSSKTAGTASSIKVTGGGAEGTLGFSGSPSATGLAGATSALPLFPAGGTLPLASGSDGNGANETDIIGTDTPPRTGLKAIEAQQGISIIAVPGWVSGGNSGLNDAVIAEMIAQCERRLDRVAVLETIDETDNGGAIVNVDGLLNERGKWNSQYAAIYAPWVTILDPLTNTEINVPPSGHVVGCYAFTDNAVGVWQAPANVVLQGILGFSRDIPTGEQDLLNPAGVNVLRQINTLGNVIWGARTIAADPTWRYVNVRRLFIFIEQSIAQGTLYAVFQPNDAALWSRLSDSVANFLTTQWQAGALVGATAQQAFFVRCDETTTTEDDQDNGIVNVLIGLAPVKPAEFIVFQIGQASQAVILAEQGTS